MSRSARAFAGTAALLFAASAVTTVAWCASMAAMPAMPMPGGWTMTMTWMRMPGQSWLAATASFLAMWMAMMVAMMLPSLLPMLWRYSQSLAGVGLRRQHLLTAAAGAGYFAVWAVVGLIVFALGIVLATLAMQHPALSRTVPILASAAIVIAGALQFSSWKAHHLACCRGFGRIAGQREAGPAAAIRQGLRLGVACARCCANLMAILLAGGVMDLGVMAIVMAAITAERLGPASTRVAHVIGVAAIAAGCLMLVLQ